MNKSVKWFVSLAMILNACAPAAPPVEGSMEQPEEEFSEEMDLGPDFTPDCTNSFAWDNLEDGDACARELGNDGDPDKFLPLVMLAGSLAHGGYRAWQVANAVAGTITVWAAGRQIQIHHQTAQNLAQTRGTYQEASALQNLIGALRNAGVHISWHEAQNIQNAAANAQPREQLRDGVPTSVTQRCKTSYNRQITNRYHESDSCGAGIDRSSCTGLVNYINATRRCIQQRKAHARQCYPNGGRGPMGSGDWGHNNAYCSKFWSMTLVHAELWERMQAGQCEPYVPSVWIPELPNSCNPFVFP